jgi:hypothetical protein
LEQDALAGPLLQRGAIGVDRLLQPGRSALAFPEPRQRVAEAFCVIAQSSAGG